MPNFIVSEANVSICSNGGVAQRGADSVATIENMNILDLFLWEFMGYITRFALFVANPQEGPVLAAIYLGICDDIRFYGETSDTV